MVSLDPIRVRAHRWGAAAGSQAAAEGRVTGASGTSIKYSEVWPDRPAGRGEGRHERLRGLVSGVARDPSIPARRPVAAAMTAATIDQISGGRFRLGLGISGPQVVEGWHGLRFDQPLARTRDYVAVVRMALSGQPVRYQGRTITVPVPDSEGKEI